MPDSSASSAPLLYTPQEAQKLLRLGRTTINELIQSGRLRSVKIGKSRRILASSLHAFVDQLETECETAP